ncbi:MAG: hypothetical protein ACOCW4_01435, partial [bacterium]
MKIKSAKWILAALSILFVVQSHSLSAQADVFQVLVTDGKAEVRQDSKWIPLAEAVSLNGSDLIRLDKGGYLGLIHKNGNRLELNKAGTYEVARLEEKITGKEKFLSSKYASLYLQQLQQPGNAIALQRERSLENQKLKILLPSSVDVFNNEVIIRWQNEEANENSYQVELKNMFDEVIHTTEVDGTKVAIDFDHKLLASERLIIVSVSSKTFKEIKSADYGMKQLSPEEAAPIARELKELKLEITNEQSALDKLILASFYEQNNLLADALTNYEYALSLAPA